MCKGKKEEKKIELSLDDKEINHRLDQIESANIPEDLRDYMINALKILIELDRIVGLQKTTIARLRKIFGKKSEKQARNPNGKNKEGKPKNSGGGRQGRNGHEDYSNVTTEYVPIKDYAAGERCPNNDGGTLYAYIERFHIVITGGAPMTAKKYIHQTLRCNICGLIIEAKSEATGKGKYDVSVRSMLAVLHYSASIPFYRLEKLQKMFSVPMPRSVQWGLIYELGMDIIVVWEYLLKLLSNSKEIMSDDTGAKILSHMKDIDEKERKKLSTTGMRSVVEGHEVVVYQTGEKNSGENLDAIVKSRTSEENLILVTDASTTNDLSEKYNKNVSHFNCLVHARRKFVDVEKAYQQEAKQVIDWIAKVYQNEAIAKEKGMSPEERLSWHQLQSQGPMDSLKTWCDRAFPEKLVEPNSALGAGIKYILNHWEGLTGFLRCTGVSLDTNILELHLRNQVLNRKNWLFFKTETGAFISDVLSSVIKTCERANENPFDYLNTLQNNLALIKEAPELWLPWNYRKNLSSPPSEAL